VQCRVLVTLPRRPDALVRAGRLLPDIRYRLGDALIAIPRLAQRREDIPVLAAHFLDQAPEATGVPGGPSAFADGVSRLLQLGDWPGNVRELRFAVQMAYLHAGAEGPIEMEHLPASALGPLRYAKRGRSARDLRGIELALTLAQGNIARAVRLTGASRATVYRTLAALERRPAPASHESCSIRRVRQNARSEEASA
jgi:two-component system nitrogen regulation response regulator NtrX